MWDKGLLGRYDCVIYICFVGISSRCNFLFGGWIKDC